MQLPTEFGSIEGILTVDAQQHIVGIDATAQRIFGCTADEVVGGALSRLIPERYRAPHAEKLRDFAQSGGTRQIMGRGRTVVGLRANGDEFPIEVLICPVEVSTPSGSVRLYTALVRDLSVVRTLRADLDAVRHKLRSAFDLAPVAVWITEGRQVGYANQACAALFGAEQPQGLVGHTLNELFSQASVPLVLQKMALVLSADSPMAVTGAHIARLDGGHRRVEIAISALPAHGPGVLQMVLTDLTLKQRERRAAEQSRRDLQRMSARQVEAREDERQHIARELHDELGQRLVALKFELTALEARVPPDGPTDQPVAGALAMVDGLMAEVRRLATDLRPMLLDDLGLNAAIESLARETTARQGVAIRLQLQELEFAPGNPAPIALYRMVQEALTNVARHAQATEVDIQTRVKGGQLLLVIEDNGVGFGKKKPSDGGSLGLVGMRERAHLLGGQLKLGKSASGGARIEVHVPLNQAPGRKAGTAALDPAVLAHELQVHQVELENQNDELRRTQQDLAQARDRYVHLYDFAPVAYITLNARGQLTELNLAAAKLLGQQRELLQNTQFERFVATGHRVSWRRNFAAALGAALPGQGPRIELTLKAADGPAMEVQVDCLRVVTPPDKQPSLRMTLTDVSHLRQAELDRRIAAGAVAAREGDRRRVARQLHEDLGQQLCALKMTLSEFQGQPEGKDRPDLVKNMLQTVDASLESVRHMASELRPLLLDNLGLMAALDWLGRDMARRNGIDIALSFDEDDPPLDEAASVALYRLVEELLLHASRGANHGRALSLSLHRQAGWLVLKVQREGSGWPNSGDLIDAVAQGGLKELAHLLGAQVDVAAAPAGGWVTTVKIPVPEITP